MGPVRRVQGRPRAFLFSELLRGPTVLLCRLMSLFWTCVHGSGKRQDYLAQEALHLMLHGMVVWCADIPW